MITSSNSEGCVVTVIYMQVYLIIIIMIIVINNFFTELFSDLHELAALFNIYLFKHSDIFNFK